MDTGAFFRSFLAERQVTGVVGSGYNGVVIRYTYRNDDYVVKVQRYDDRSRLRIVRESAIQNRVALELIGHGVVDSLCPLMLVYDTVGIDAATSRDMMQIQLIGRDQAKFDAYLSLIARWRHRISSTDGVVPLTPEDGRQRFNVQVQRFCGSETLESYAENILQQNLLQSRREEVRCYFFELVWALHALHSRLGLIHNDLAATNITMEEVPQARDRVNRFLFTGGTGGEWSFIRMASGERRRDWLKTRVRREVDEELYEFPVRIPYGQGTPNFIIDQRESGAVFRSGNDDERSSIDQNAFDGRGLYYKVLLSAMRPRIIDFGQSVLLRTPDYPEPVGDAGTEFSLLNDVGGFGAARIPYPEYFFTRSLQRSYETDVWDLAINMLNLALAGYDTTEDVLRLRRRQQSVPSNEPPPIERYYNQVTGKFPLDSGFRTSLLMLLRADIVADGSFDLRPTPRFTRAIAEISVLLRTPSLASSDVLAKEAARERVNANRSEMFQVALLVMRLQQVLGNGFLPGASIVKDDNGDRRIVIERYEPWPEIQYTRMYRAVVASPAARSLFTDFNTDFFDELVRPRLLDVLGDDGLELITRRMMAWAPYDRLRCGYATRPDSLERLFESVRANHGSTAVNIVESFARTHNDPWRRDRAAAAPLGLGYALLDPYFAALATSSTRVRLPPRRTVTPDQAQFPLNQSTEANINVDVKLRDDADESITVDVADWSSLLQLPLYVYQNEEAQAHVVSTLITEFRHRLQPVVATRKRAYAVAVESSKIVRSSVDDAAKIRDSENVYRPYEVPMDATVERVRRDAETLLFDRAFAPDSGASSPQEVWDAVLRNRVPTAIKEADDFTRTPALNVK